MRIDEIGTRKREVEIVCVIRRFDISDLLSSVTRLKIVHIEKR